MQMSSTRRVFSSERNVSFLLADDTVNPVPVLVLGAGLALAVAVIDLQDQGGLLGSLTPEWMKFGYDLVEILSTISAALIVRGELFGWVLGLASSIGPMVGYILSRTVGVHGDSGDVGNWQLGVSTRNGQPHRRSELRRARRDLPCPRQGGMAISFLVVR
jgi:hypothetical protein